MREGVAWVVFVCGLAVLVWACAKLQRGDYLGAFLAFLTGASVVRAGLELLRPRMGE